MECALFRKDYDPARTSWPPSLITLLTIFMECALFRKDYDVEHHNEEDNHLHIDLYGMCLV